MLKRLGIVAVLATAAVSASAQTSWTGSGVSQVPPTYRYGVSCGKIGFFDGVVGASTSSTPPNWARYFCSVKIRPGYYIYGFDANSDQAYYNAKNYVYYQRYNLVGQGAVKVPTGYTYGVSCGLVGGHNGYMLSRAASTSTDCPEYICSVSLSSTDYLYFFGATSTAAYNAAVAYYN